VSLLQRLAGQARSAGGPRIRSAAAAIAQPSIALPARAAVERVSSAAVEHAVLPRVPHAAESAATGARVIESDASDAGTGRAPHHAEAPSPFDRVAPSPSIVIRSEPGAPAVELRALEPTAASVTPAPLLGEIAPRMPATAAIGAIRPAAPVEPIRRDASEPTEVHVHIGRIEVTALQSPAAAQPKAPARRTRPSVPLTDYLANRRLS
jgi:hypothetical protein